MIFLQALGWYQITGRGDVAVVASASLPPGPADGSDLLGRDVLIDGRPYTVAGVEWCLVNHGHRCPKPYGLLVKEQKR